MLSALCFVPKAVRLPIRHELSVSEWKLLLQQQQNEQNEQQQAEAEDCPSDLSFHEASSDAPASSNAPAPPDAPSTLTNSFDEKDEKQNDTKMDIEEKFLHELNMDAYDSDTNASELESIADDETSNHAQLMLGGKTLTVYSDNKEDPYITMQSDEDEYISDDEDLTIRHTDTVMVVGNTEEENSNIEVYVYEPETGSLFVHHDFALPSFPLAIQWCSTQTTPTPTTAAAAAAAGDGNFVAVGMFEPGIEIWNLDVLDAMEPVTTLGGYVEQQENDRTNRKKKNMQKLKPESHTDAVMAMTWHVAHKERMASGGADKIIKLWDITTQQCTQNMQPHSDKIQALHFNVSEPSILLSGSYDRTVAMIDVRSGSKLSTTVEADIESVRWSNHQPFMFLASTENGSVYAYDARQMHSSSSNGNSKTAPLFSLAAHDQATTAVSFHATVPNIFCTSSIDKTVKVWDFTDNKPSLICSRDLKIGEVFTASFECNVDTPFLIAAGGNKGKLAIWDITENRTVRNRYAASINLTQHANFDNTEEHAEATNNDSVIGKSDRRTPHDAQKSKKKRRGDSDDDYSDEISDSDLSEDGDDDDRMRSE